MEKDLLFSVPLPATESVVGTEHPNSSVSANTPAPNAKDTALDQQGTSSQPLNITEPVSTTGADRSEPSKPESVPLAAVEPVSIAEAGPPEPNQPQPAPQPALPKRGNDCKGIVSGYAGRRCLVKLEGGFVVQATLAKGMREPDQGRLVSVRITQVDPAGQEITGEIRKVY